MSDGAFRDEGALLEQIRRLQEENGELRRDLERARAEVTALTSESPNRDAFMRRLTEERDDLLRERDEARDRLATDARQARPRPLEALNDFLEGVFNRK